MLEEMEGDIFPVLLPEGGDVMNSTGEIRGGDLLTPPSSKEKLLPHYMQASTNSCHDFCKYGRKHDFDVKGIRLSPRRKMVDADMNVENQTEKLNLGERKKKPVIMLKSTQQQKTELSHKPKISNQKASSPAKKIEISDKDALALKLMPRVASLQSPSTPSRDRSGKINSNDSALDYTGGLSGGRDSGNKQTDSSRGLNSGRDNESNRQSGSSGGLNSRRDSENKQSAALGGMNSRIYSVNKQSDSSGGLVARRNSENKLVKKLGEKVLKPLLRSLSRKPTLIRVASLSRVPSSNRAKYKGIKTAETGMIQNKARKPDPNNDKIKEKAPLEESKPGKKTVEPVRRRNHTIQLSQSPLSPTSLSSAPSCQSSLEEKESESAVGKAGDSALRSKKPETKKPGVISKSGTKKMPKGRETVHIDDKENLQKKSQFRGGKVVNVESENNGPRRLKFRQGRVVGENQNKTEEKESMQKKLKFSRGKVVSVESESQGLRRLSFRRGRAVMENQNGAETKEIARQKLQPGRGKVASIESVNSFSRRFRFWQGRAMGENQNNKGEFGRRSFRLRKRELGGGSNASKPGYVTVVLRHRDVQRKKEKKGLFNDVIEETANKLVETRKSKVKALVGAFETVISLQESKPTAITPTKSTGAVTA